MSSSSKQVPHACFPALSALAVGNADKFSTLLSKIGPSPLTAHPNMYLAAAVLSGSEVIFRDALTRINPADATSWPHIKNGTATTPGIPVGLWNSWGARTGDEEPRPPITVATVAAVHLW